MPHLFLTLRFLFAPHDKPKLYAIVETIKNNGSVFQYDIGEDKSLIETGPFEASGKSTCYLALSPNRDIAIVINYWDAIIDVVEVVKTVPWEKSSKASNSFTVKTANGAKLNIVKTIGKTVKLVHTPIVRILA